VELEMLAAAVAAVEEQVVQAVTAAAIQHRERVVWVLNSRLDLELFMLAAAAGADTKLALRVVVALEEIQPQLQ
jgi:hypothetical protein